MTRTRSAQLGPAARPVALPADVDDSGAVKASGIVRLPHHICWSGPDVAYDLADLADRARVYEKVMQEGTDEDVRFYVDVDDLLVLWDSLVLSPSVRAGWANWFRRHRDIDLPC